MKICFFPHYSFSNRDGAILSMYNLIDALLDRGVEVVVVLPNQNHLEEWLKDGRIEFIHVPMFSMRMTISRITPLSNVKFGIKYLHNERCVNQIVAALEKKQIDCIHINGLDSSVGAKVARKLKIPYIWHIRAFMEKDLGKRLFRQRETYKLVQEAAIVVGISKDIQRKFEQDLKRPVKVIYNGIPEERYQIPNRQIFTEEKLRLFLAGRISVQKGQIVAIKAVEELQNRGRDTVYLTLIGQGETKEYLEEIRAYIKQHDLDGRVCVNEHLDNLCEMRRQHDIGLTCSQREAFGRVTVENMMAGMLVIGSDSGGTPEIISDGVTGLLYKTDAPDDLADTIEAVMDDIDRARMIAENGYRYSLNNFSIQRVADEVIRLYESLM